MRQEREKMKISTIILGILFFAIATMIIYGWGIIRQKNQSGDLMKILFSKGQARVKKYVKMHGAITLGQAAKLCEELEARQPFSANKAVVKDARDFAGQLLAYMVKTGQVEKRGAEYIFTKEEHGGSHKK